MASFFFAFFFIVFYCAFNILTHNTALKHLLDQLNNTHLLFLLFSILTIEKRNPSVIYPFLRTRGPPSETNRSRQRAVVAPAQLGRKIIPGEKRRIAEARAIASSHAQVQRAQAYGRPEETARVSLAVRVGQVTRACSRCSPLPEKQRRSFWHQGSKDAHSKCLQLSL